MTRKLSVEMLLDTSEEGDMWGTCRVNGHLIAVCGENYIQLRREMREALKEYENVEIDGFVPVKGCAEWEEKKRWRRKRCLWKYNPARLEGLKARKERKKL